MTTEMDEEEFSPCHGRSRGCGRPPGITPFSADLFRGALRDTALEPQILKGLKLGALLKLKSVRRDTHELRETCARRLSEFDRSALGPD
jgi:hypothetical protein